MIREFYDSSEDDEMESQYQIDPECMVLTRPDCDMHNRCCGGKAWCIRDICGIICAVLTWLLILYAEFVVMMVMLLPSVSTYPVYSYINIFIFQSLAFLAFASHLRTMFTDPGAVPKGNATKEMIKQMSFREGQVIFKCTKCCSIKPERAHHCSVCQRCIRKMDHHCPWVNNCVGENNQKYFVLFTFYIAAISIHAVCLAVYQFVTCIRHEWRDCSTYSPPATVVLLLFLIAEALLFAIFTAVMLGTQLHAIWNDETMRLALTLTCLLTIVALSVCRPYDPEDDALKDVLPSDGQFEAFYPRESHGIPNGSSRPAHGHGSFYKHRNPALVDVKNAAAYGFRFDGMRRFNFDDE